MSEGELTSIRQHDEMNEFGLTLNYMHIVSSFFRDKHSKQPIERGVREYGYKMYWHVLTYTPAKGLEFMNSNFFRGIYIG